MVQDYVSPVRVHKYPFEMVMAAYERRFPSCPQIPVVIECAITDDSWSSDDSQRHTTRRCQLNVEAPYLLKKMIGVDYIYFIQKNHLDLKNRVLEIEATNETFSTRVGVVEKCRYYVHPENSEWTCFEQSATLDVKNFFGLENTVEKIAMKQYAANIAKGKELIESFMLEVHADGIKELKPWKVDTPGHNAELRRIVSRGAEPMSPTAVTEPKRHSQPDQYTLDSDYIKRYLGELTPMQESRLLQLRKLIADLQKGKVPSDTTLLRFLRARDFNVEKAREMLSQSLLWRKKHQVDRILSEYETPDVVKQYFPGGWHHHDKDGRPLYILRLGQMDVKGLLKSVGEDGLLKLTLHVCEEGLKLLEEATRSSEHAVHSWCLLVDLDGLNMRHLWRPGVRALLRIIQIVEANYPETMGRVLIVRAPRVFPILWTIVSTFIDENTRSKFLFYGGKDYLQPGGLLDYIPKDLIPDFLGGPCKTDIVDASLFVPQQYYYYSFVHEGGLVPKNLYVAGVFTERDGDPLSEDSVYRCVSLGKGQLHEVIVVNRDPQSVLTWDFDVLRHDIAFTVYRSDHELDHQRDDDDNSAGLCVGVGGGEEAAARSLLERRGWREGHHYHRVEPTLVCHDGESIQGSHVMMESGSYVLQWRCELLDTTHRAAQLVYFHETLASHHYKGSMSSLQSGTSGFSCLSGKSAASSCPSR
ncbi:protein real-time isoform X2 [Galleria mellonella]|uniref:Protein real-time isoform X2 n=1 Tax=Galleria mellonella TaxID=7137 RepID=A0ABM3MQ05_GALME|nr:protein real-time isoform X2 [Galleria mellonella]